MIPVSLHVNFFYGRPLIIQNQNVGRYDKSLAQVYCLEETASQVHDAAHGSFVLIFKNV